MKNRHPVPVLSFWAYIVKRPSLPKKSVNSILFWVKNQLSNANLIICTSAVQILSGAVVCKYRQIWPEVRYWFIEIRLVHLSKLMFFCYIHLSSVFLDSSAHTNNYS